MMRLQFNWVKIWSGWRPQLIIDIIFILLSLNVNIFIHCQLIYSGISLYCVLVPLPGLQEHFPYDRAGWLWHQLQAPHCCKRRGWGSHGGECWAGTGETPWCPTETAPWHPGGPWRSIRCVGSSNRCCTDEHQNTPPWGRRGEEPGLLSIIDSNDQWNNSYFPCWLALYWKQKPHIIKPDDSLRTKTSEINWLEFLAH